MINLKVNSDIIEDVQLVIFDKDGTLMELYHYWSQMVGLRAQSICERLGLAKDDESNLIYEMGVDIKAGRLRSEGPVGLKKREIVLQAAIDYLTDIGIKDTYDLCFEVFQEVDQLSSNGLNRFILPIQGSLSLINSLFYNKCRIAIATTDKSYRAKLAMDFLGFSDKIDFIVGADNVDKTKPDPEMIDLIVDRMRIDKSHTVMIGDALVDVQMGINAQVRASIGVLTGFATLEQIKEITPYVAKSVAMLEVVGSILS